MVRDTYRRPMAEEYADGINRPQECRETEKIFLVAIVSLGTGARRTKDLGDDRTRRSRGDGGDFEERKSVNIGVGRAAICEPISDKRGTVEFRTEVAGVLASRAAKIAYKRAGF